MSHHLAARRFALQALATTLVVLAPAARAQDPGHGATPADIERGGQTFMLSCASCHGPNGDTVAGVNLASGSFRRATSDQELVALIQKGIPGTAMPPSSLTEAQAMQVVAYLRSLPARAAASRTSGLAGSATAGRALYATLDCATCHRVDGTGGFLGPDLSSVGITRRADEIERALTDPDADLRNGSRTVAIVTARGESITGRLLNQDTYTLQFIDADGKLAAVRKDEVRRWEIMERSAMPGYAGRLTPQQLADLVSHLQTLNAPVPIGGVSGAGGRRGGPPPATGAGGAGRAGGRGARGGTP
jgi:putative heme-binding domain-containing protein